MFSYDQERPPWFCKDQNPPPSTHCAKLYVARYRPIDPRNADHWNIYIRDAEPSTGRETIHQVLPTRSKHGRIRWDLQRRKWGLRPQDHALWECSVEVGDVEMRVVDAVRDLIQDQSVWGRDREGGWNSQDWVMGVLEVLDGLRVVRVREEAIRYLQGERQR